MCVDDNILNSVQENKINLNAPRELDYFLNISADALVQNIEITELVKYTISMD